MEPKELFTRVGGPTKLAKSLGYKTHTAVLKWHEIPLHRCLEIERLLGIPREELRPDFFIGLRAFRLPPVPSTDNAALNTNTALPIKPGEILQASAKSKLRRKEAERYEP